MPARVSPERRTIAKDFGLEHVDEAARACRRARLPFFVACALLEQESNGRNVFGHDEGGAFAGYPGEVTEDGYRIFRWMVIDNGHTSNGVGPTQITWAGTVQGSGTRTGGFFVQMEEEGLRPWDPQDNMLFGFKLLRDLFVRNNSSWRAAGTKYNGKATYGDEFLSKVREWKVRLKVRGPLPT